MNAEIARINRNRPSIHNKRILQKPNNHACNSCKETRQIEYEKWHLNQQHTHIHTRKKTAINTAIALSTQYNGNQSHMKQAMMTLDKNARGNRPVYCSAAFACAITLCAQCSSLIIRIRAKAFKSNDMK